MQYKFTESTDSFDGNNTKTVLGWDMTECCITCCLYIYHFITACMMCQVYTPENILHKCPELINNLQNNLK